MATMTHEYSAHLRGYAASSNLIDILRAISHTKGPHEVAICGFDHQDMDMSSASIGFNAAVYSSVSKCVNATLQRISTETSIIMTMTDLLELREAVAMISWFYTTEPKRAGEVHIYLTLQESTWNMKDVEAFLKSMDLNATLDSNFYVVDCTNNALDLWEFYTIRKLKIFQRVGHLRWKNLGRYIIRRGDFRQVPLRGLIQVDSYVTPALQYSRAKNGSIVAAGIAIDMFNVMGSTLNHSTELVKIKGWIQKAENGGIIGMGAQLLRNEGDLIMSFSEILLYRAEALAMSLPVHSRTLEAFIAKPDASYYRNIFTQPFQGGLWAALAAGGLATCACFLFVGAIKMKFHQLPNELEKPAGAIFWTLAAYCQKPWRWSSISLTLLIVGITASSSSLFYYTVYSASIISMFSVEFNPISSIDHLVDHGFVFYGNRLSFKAFGYAEAQALQNGETSSSRDIGVPEALEKIQMTRAAFLSVRGTFFGVAVLQRSVQEICSSIVTIPFKNDSQTSVIYFRKFDAIRKFMDYHLVHWKEHGLIDRLHNSYDRRLMNRCDLPARTLSSLSLIDLRSAYSIQIFGFVTGIAIFIAEVLKWSRGHDSNVVSRVRIKI